MDAPVATSVIGGKVPIRARKERAERIHTMWRDYAEQRDAWARECANDEDFFLGNQWTRAQILALGEKGMAPIVINRTMPLILQEVAIFTARSPGFKVIPREDGDVELAHLWGDILSYIWQNSNGDSELQQTARDYFCMGAGYMHSYIDPIADDGRGEVMIESVPIWDVYWDPNSRKIDGSDARAVIISRVIDEDSLIYMYPSKKDFIRKAASQGYDAMEYGRPQVNPQMSASGRPMESFEFYPSNNRRSRKVRVNQCYEKILMPMVRINYLSTGRIAIMPEDAWDKELEEGNPAIVVERFLRKQIRMTQTIGVTDLLFEAILPTEHYPIVPFWLHHTRTPYPKGDTNVIKGSQLEVNKRRSISLHNSMLAGNFKIVHEEGAISNEAEYEQKGTVPGFRLKYKKGFQEPKPWYPQALPNAWYTMEQQSAQDMEYSLSVFAHMMGSNADAPETYRGLLALEEAGQRKIQHKARHANHAIRILGKVCVDLAQAIYTQPKLLRIVGDGEQYREVWLNQKQIDPLTGQMRTVNELGVGRYDIVVTDGTSMPTNRMAMLNLYLEMFQMGVIDATEVLKKTDIDNKDAVLERIGEIQTLKRQVEAVVDENKQLVGLNQTLRRKSQQDEIHLIAQQATESTRDQVRQTTQEQKLARARIGDAVKNFQQRLLLTEKKVQLDGREITDRLQLERDKQKALTEVRNAQRATSSPKAQ